MTEQVKFKVKDVNPVSYGRNGDIITTGLEICDFGGSEVDLKPITSKGNTSYNCILSLPKTDVPELIKILKKFI